ncbi:hypothetical protein [Rhodoferax sp. U11-2br]|uniref:hypothetical protein n=1 Tax=Rhodoferax sp. U11-2br TaxID=2838878 RepID=UPI001BE61447|nr:hypothetical protein [Rhodoferax sp. U11-2br]MBT3068842.1 hypothetical protein [Rhodoferax sp. U11-2br]
MSNELTSVVNLNRLKDSVRPSAKRLGERLGVVAVSLFIGRLAQCLEPPGKDRHSYIWRSAIEDHEQDSNDHSVPSTFVDMVRDSALGAISEGTPEVAAAVVRLLLKSELVTVVRIGLYVCSEHYGPPAVSTAFWESFKPEWLSGVEYWHETYWLVKKAFSRFSAAERKRFLEAVGGLRKLGPDGALTDEVDDEQRRDILGAAAGNGDAEIDAMYGELVKQLGAPRSHPDFHTYMESSPWSGELSPVSTESLLSMSDEELFAYLLSFRPEPSRWEGPTYRGLASQLAAAVRASEDGFSQRTARFIDMPRPYQHGLLSGLRDRWTQDKREIDWEATVGLIESIVGSPGFQVDANAPVPDGHEPNTQWVIGDIAMLVKSGAQGDKLPKELVVRLVNALVKVLEVTPAISPNDADEAVSQAINSPRGKTLEALITTSMAVGRVGSDTAFAWSLVDGRLNAELATSEVGQNGDFATLAGMYCPGLHFLNPQWVEGNFDRIFSKANDTAWRCAAHGFAYQTQVYKWLFRKLADGGHLGRMVSGDAVPKEAHKKAVQFLAVAYLNGDEPLTGTGILSTLITELRVQELSELCWFYWTLRGKSGAPSPHAPKILDFWQRVAEVIRDRGNAYPKLQSDLSYLAPFVAKLEQPIVQVWSEAAPFADVNHHGHILLEYLAAHVKESPDEVAQIFDEALKGFRPVFQEEDLVAIVKGLAAAGRMDKAQAYCHQYGQLTPPMLKTLYEELRAAERKASS